MSFRLVPKSMTLNDLERRNGRYIVNCAPLLTFDGLRTFLSLSNITLMALLES